jgi:glycogen debranching enzyme
MYMTKDLTKNELIPVETVSDLIPLFSTTITKTKADLLAAKISELMKNDKVKYKLPSTFPSQEELFEPSRYWRGPVWIITNELVADGLCFYGHTQLATELRTTNLQLVMQTLDEYGGFYEYYNPITGMGLGSAKQSWTAAALLKSLDGSLVQTTKVRAALTKNI